MLLNSDPDELRGWCKAYRWLSLISGEDKNVLTNTILCPESVKDDQDVLKKLEAWQSDREEANLRGVSSLGPEQRIVVIKRIVTLRWKEGIENPRKCTNHYKR